MVEFETNDNIFAFISATTVTKPTKERGWSDIPVTTLRVAQLLVNYCSYWSNKHMGSLRSLPADEMMRLSSRTLVVVRATSFIYHVRENIGWFKGS
jgi:hypothetical protein